VSLDASSQEYPWDNVAAEPPPAHLPNGKNMKDSGASSNAGADLCWGSDRAALLSVQVRTHEAWRRDSSTLLGTSITTNQSAGKR